MRLLPLSIALLSLIAALSCTRKEAPVGSGAAGTTAGQVNLAIWSNYVTPEALAEFTKATGIAVQVSHYSSNEELLAKLQAGASGIDVAVPTDYILTPMIELGLLQKLDLAKISNASKLDPSLKGQSYDPRNEYTLPYSFGTSGLAIDRRRFKGRLMAWKDLFEKPELAGRFTLFDDAREVFGMVLKLQGESLNEKDPAKLEAAKKFLLSQKKKVKGFSSETKQALIEGEVFAAQAYSSDALQAAAETGGAIEYLIPEEGATLWIDSVVIPKGAKNLEAAHRLIDFLLSAPTGTSLTSRMWLATSNQEAQMALPEAIRKNVFVFPPMTASKSGARLETMRDIGEGAALIERFWTEIKAE